MSYVMRSGHVRSILPLAALLAVSAPAAAVEPLDTFSVRLGGYINRFDTQVRADGETRPGTVIDLEGDLNLDPEDTLGFAALTWRPFQRHEFGFSYFRDSSSSDHQLERDIVFEGNVYEASATVRAGYDLDVYDLYYVWWGVTRENWALGPRLGLIWYQFDLDIGLRLDVDGNPVGEGSLDGSASADLPAPAIGVSWRWTPAEDWRLLAELGYFSTNINDIDGDVAYGRFGVEWHPWERVGLMLDYTHSHIDLEVEKDNFNGGLDFKNSGVRLGVVYRF